MFRVFTLLIVAAGLVSAGIFGSSALTHRLRDEGDRQKLWQEVEQAMEKRLPRTAIEKLEAIIADARQDEDFSEATRALAMKYIFEGAIEGSKPTHMVEQLRENIDEQPEEMQPLLNAALANWMFVYYQQNRWRFAQRTETTTLPSEDFETWSLPQLLDEIDRRYTQALANTAQLQNSSVEAYQDLLVAGNLPTSYRPTLFDFLAHEAIEFYSLDEQIVRPQQAFVLPADSPVLGNVESFLDWEPSAPQDDAPLLKAVRLYQQVLRFHRDDEDRSAFLDANLARLQFGYQQASGSENEARYRAALQRFADQHLDHQLSSLALARLASVWHEAGDYVTAHEVAATGKNRFPDSPGGKQCHNLINQIEAKSSSISTERIWNRQGNIINLAYRNIDRVYFRLVKIRDADWQRNNYGNVENLDWEVRRKLISRPVVASFSKQLPATSDYQQRTENISWDPDVPPGGYYLIASHRDDFRENENQVAFCEVWISDITAVMRNNHTNNKVEGQVFLAEPGTPVSEAIVEPWFYDQRQNRLQRLTRQTTDSSGLFSLPARQNGYHLLMIRQGDSRLLLADRTYHRQQNRGGIEHSTVLFTDRAIYRPGQTINFKGIVLASDRENNKYQTSSGQRVPIRFLDVNGQEIERMTLVSNEFGSISGQFTAPTGRVTGQMSIRVGGAARGYASIRVEEYKRPKFFVEMEPPADPPRLEGEVTVSGNATAYTGAAIDSAKVAYRVVREVRYPVWWYWRCWWFPPVDQTREEIASGVAGTQLDGSFDISFEAVPDPSAPRESQPTFQYTVYADVTDTAGETRSSSLTINVGYTALKAKLDIAEWQMTSQPVRVEVKTESLDGEPLAASGSLKIFQLEPPEQVHRRPLPEYRYHYRSINLADQKPQADLSDYRNWPVGESVAQQPFETTAEGTSELDFELGPGAYKAILETQDKFGNPVSAEFPFLTLDPNSENLQIKLPHLFLVKSTSLQPGDNLELIWGTGYASGLAFVEFEHRGQTIKRFWTEGNRTQSRIELPVTESLRGGFHVHLTFVRNHRVYTESRRIDVPWDNKRLQVKWEHFVSKLKPGAEETWTVSIQGPDAERAAGELVAAMYDASLDAFAPHSWQAMFNVFYQDYSRMSLQSANQIKNLRAIWNNWSQDYGDSRRTYWSWHPQIVPSGAPPRLNSFSRRDGVAQSMDMDFAGGGEAAAPAMEMSDDLATEGRMLGQPADSKGVADPGVAGYFGKDGQGQPDVDLSQVAARTNLNETAFFFPHLTTDENGEVRFTFTMPEALTQWKFLGFAHDNQLRAGLLTDEAITSKDLMVQPNPPRFLREGDLIEFSVKVTNQSETTLSGQVRLTFADARTEQSMDAALGNQQVDQSFEIPAQQSTSLFWRITVPDYTGVLTYKAVAATEKLSDGEEGFLPVLSKRILVTESLPLPIRGEQTKQFEFERLLNSADSDSIQSQTYTVQVTSNPAWYAVLALPYLMEFPHECSEQVFNRLYANSIARYIATSDPRIARVFEQWRGTEALDSPLEKNQDLKSLMIENTPWLRDAVSESQARRNVGLLFEANRMNDEIARAAMKLSEMQYDDGRWPWFPGGRANDYITLYVTTGFGRLRHLGVDVDLAPALQAVPNLDAWLDRIYKILLRTPENLDENHLSPIVCFYLYGRSFFLEDVPIAAEHRDAVNYFLKQAQNHWNKLANRLSQGYLAIGLKRFGVEVTPNEIIDSLRERSINHEELGMFWREGEKSWWWYRAPIETQALMIEAFDEVAGDPSAVEDLRVWLIKQKQTQKWENTKATADAVYSLLLRGANLLSSKELVTVTLGDLQIEPQNVEAGTGFYQQRFVRGEIKPEMGRVTLQKKDPGVAWGSVHWQYLQDIAEIEPYEGTPLTLKKSVYRKIVTPSGLQLEPLEGAVNVGDELVTRVELRVDRQMEFVHLKDYRGSGTEPINVLSQYRFQDGLYYYESTRDTATHFFIDNLPPGTYVFESSVRVQLKGQYESGIAEIQCMYAPEFNSHSESVSLTVE